MLDYHTGMMIARTEHQQMTQSLSPVSEYSIPDSGHRPGWLSQQLGRLSLALGSGLAAQGKRLMEGQNKAPKASSARQE